MFNSSHKELCSDRGCDSCRDVSENVDCTYIKRAKPSSESNTPVDQKKKRLHDSGASLSQEKKAFIEMFTMWSSGEQVDFICHLLSKISHFQQSQINHLLEPLLKRDFILALQSRGVPYLAEMILVQLDATSLLSVELVSRGWQWSVAKYQLWRRLLVRRLASDPVWHGLCERRGWLDLVNLADPAFLPVMLERRRVSMGLRQKMTEFPMFLDNGCSADLCAQSKASKSISSQSASSSMLVCHCQLGANNPNVNSLRVKPHSADPASPHTQKPSVSNSSFSHELDLDLVKTPCCSSSSANEQSSHKPSIGNVSFTMDTEIHDSASAETMMFAHRFYKQLYPRIIRDIKRIEDNWIHGNYRLTRIPCRSDITKGVYCLQYDKEKIVSGLRDDTIKVWRRLPSTSQASKSKPYPSESPKQANRPEVDPPAPNEFEAANDNRARGDGPVADAPAAYAGDGEASNPENCAASATSDGYHCTQVIEGHSGSVLCLQYIGDLLISGSSDTTVRLWDLSTGCCLNIICHHTEAVLHLRFRDNVLVTCSKDRSIAVWDMGPWPKDVQLRQVLVGHRAAVNVVDFDEKYIVSASGDRTIKVWATDTCAYVRTLTGHRRGIACLQYRDRIVVSGSSDNTIRIWDIETGVCFRVLEGHEELVRCIRFDSKRIVSGAYDGKIKVWNLKAALNPRSKPNQLCIRTLQQHTGRVFRLQFDDFQIVSSSHDDTILIWDFARPSAGSEERDDGFDDGINAVLASQSNCLCTMRQCNQGQPNSDSNVQDLC